MTVGLFIPCIMDQLFPQTAFNVVKVLERAGCEVRYNPEQTCCGQIAFNSGHWDDAKFLGDKFLYNYPEEIPIVSPSASCISMVRKSYDDLFTNTKNHNRCRSVQSNCYELSDFLVNVLKKDYFGAEMEIKAVYHDACGALHGCGIKSEPRQLLSQVGGFQLLESSDSEVCCGFGGSFAHKFGDISSAMAEQKVENALEKGAEAIISTDSSCLLHLQTYIDKKKLPLKTLHLADVISHGWPNI